MFLGMRIRSIFLSLFCLLVLTSVVCAENNYNPPEKNFVLQNEFADYMTNLRTKIQHNWNPPEFVEGGSAVVMFRVGRFGDVSNIQVIESSNNVVFDESALEALRKSEPFDKFPTATSKNALTIKYTFNTTCVKTDTMQAYVQKLDKYYNVDNEQALKFANLAIDEVQGDIASYFLYGKRSKIKRALGDYKGADEDLVECKRLKAKYDQKRINSCKLYAEMENSAFAYFSLAHSYEIAEDYQHAIEAIDKAISMTELNNNYKRYRAELLRKTNL